MVANGPFFIKASQQNHAKKVSPAWLEMLWDFVRVSQKVWLFKDLNNCHIEQI